MAKFKTLVGKRHRWTKVKGTNGRVRQTTVTSGGVKYQIGQKKERGGWRTVYRIRK